MAKSNYSTNISFTKFKNQLKVCNQKLEALKTANDALDEAMCSVYEDLQVMGTLNWYANMAGFIDNNTKWYNNWKDTNNELKIGVNAFQDAINSLK